MEISLILDEMIKAREIMSNIIKHDVRDDVVWLSAARESAGCLDSCIYRLKEDIKKGKEKIFNPDF